MSKLINLVKRIFKNKKISFHIMHFNPSLYSVYGGDNYFSFLNNNKGFKLKRWEYGVTTLYYTVKPHLHLSLSISK